LIGTIAEFQYFAPRSRSAMGIKAEKLGRSNLIQPCRQRGHLNLPLTMQAGRCSELEHDPEKWEPVFGKDHAQTRN
jgi:hypothetical protein